MDKPTHGSVSLPRSKSESQRALMIAAHQGFLFDDRIENLSTAHDTVLLHALLKKILAPGGPGLNEVADTLDGSCAVLVDCEDAGTVARFLLPLLASRPGTWLVTGTERLCQRPMGPLVEALRQLGADIVYRGSEGMLPLCVQGRPLRGGAVHLDGSQSSQFASALLLAAPTWEEGLTLCLDGPVVSKPYLDMTLAMMRQAGASVHDDGVATLSCSGDAPYQPCGFDIAPDWSASSYWYEFVALHPSRAILLEGLRPTSLQGDAVVAEWYRRLGVRTTFDGRGALLAYDGSAAPSQPLAWSFENHPDLFPAVFVTCVALHLPAEFTGIQNLSLKESDRVKALVTELSKLYTFINIIEDDKIILQESRPLCHDDHDCAVSLDTHGDHRLAMALAPLKTRFPRLALNHPEVVNKSYPHYWSELETLMD